MIIIGITGNLGAGKGTVVQYLKEAKGFMHFSARAFITKEVEKRGLPLDRNSMNIVSNDLRQQNTPSFIIESLYHEAKKAGGNCIIESIHTLGEIEALKNIGHFYLFGVTADLPLRYDRVILRGSTTDHISYDEFVAQNEKESASSDPHKQNLNACIAKADIVLNNNGTIDTLHKEIEEAFAKLEISEN